MPKAILRVGYTEYVMDLQQAITVAECIANSEQYTHEYRPEGKSTHHIFQSDKKPEDCTIRVLTDAFYTMAKLAGQPAEKN